MSSQAVLQFFAFFAANIVFASAIGIFAERSMLAWRRSSRASAQNMSVRQDQLFAKA